MKLADFPRLLIILILIIVAAAFLGGTFRLIHPAQAASVSTAISARSNAAFINNPEVRHQEASITPTLIPTESPLGTPEPAPASADTGGIIALAIVIVVTIVLGSALGLQSFSPKKKKG